MAITKPLPQQQLAPADTNLFVLLVMNNEDELDHAVGPFTSRAAAAKYREGLEAERFEVIELQDPYRPHT
jgi:hypothetical protein